MPQFDRDMLQSLRSPKIPLQFEIPDGDWKLLRGFMETAQLSLNSKVFQKGLPCNFVLNWDKDKGFWFDGELPDEDDIAVVLHRMRPFILQKESTYLIKILNALARYITHPVFRSVVAGIKDEFTGKSFQEQMKVTADRYVVNSDEMVNNWLNGYEFHRGEDARAAFQVFGPTVPEQWQRAVLISMIFTKVDATRNAWVLVNWIDRQDGEPLLLSA